MGKQIQSGAFPFEKYVDRENRAVSARYGARVDTFDSRTNVSYLS
jgi:hypothetical protein